MYTAAVLDKNSSELLKNLLNEQQDFGEIGYQFRTAEYDLPHHMTINLGGFDARLNPSQFLQAQALLRIERFLYNDDVCAAEVSTAIAVRIENGVLVETCDLYTINDERSRAHITVCLRPPTRPVQSNYLFSQESSPKIIELEEALILVASIKVCS